MEKLKELYSVQEVSEILGVSQKSVRDFINAGELEAVKVGQWRIAKESIQKFMEARSSQYRVKAITEVKKFTDSKKPMEPGQDNTLIIRDYHTSRPKLHGEYMSLMIQQLSEKPLKWHYNFDDDLARARHIFVGDFDTITQLLKQLDEKLREEE